MLYFTESDGPIGSSPTPIKSTNRPIQPARDTQPVQPREPTISAQAKASLWELTDPRAPTHMVQLFFVLAQLFGATASHFLVSLSDLVIVNSVIFCIVNSVILTTELSYFMILSAILLQWTQSFC
jgi:hypothetical protein